MIFIRGLTGMSMIAGRKKLCEDDYWKNIFEFIYLFVKNFNFVIFLGRKLIKRVSENENNQTNQISTQLKLILKTSWN